MYTRTRVDFSEKIFYHIYPYTGICRLKKDPLPNWEVGLIFRKVSYFMLQPQATISTIVLDIIDFLCHFVNIILHDLNGECD